MLRSIAGRPAYSSVDAARCRSRLPIAGHQASAAYPLGLFDKIKKAVEMQGTKYIHIHTPCPPGWGFDPRYSIKLGRLAIETGYFDLYEVERGEFRLTGASEKLVEKRGLVPVAEYLKTQSRLRVMTEEQIAHV
jgi:pyruvate ferredoxin oxidoreductase beta subunit